MSSPSKPDSVKATVMRGGTSKGLYFYADELPDDAQERNQLLLSLMGSPDVRQIDGMGGAHPLTSKVAIISLSDRDDADVSYLFLQVSVNTAEVFDNQNCGNILAGVAPWAIENGLVEAQEDATEVRIFIENTNSIAISNVLTPNKKVTYIGDTQIDGVPGSAAPITLEFLDIAGSSCGALFPTGNTIDTIDGVEVTCIDNGMPVVLICASDLGVSGYESPEELEQNQALKDKVESIRLQAGKMMNLGDVSNKTTPKMSLISAATQGGLVNTRTFIPHRVHEAIGVLGAVSVATGVVLKNTVGQRLVSSALNSSSDSEHNYNFNIEHPTGYFTINMDISNNDGELAITRTALVRTARKLMEGYIYPAQYN